ncbi:MAG: putative toxin-antitoxin system toxin component, PIN family [Nanoarchaeota archaeon]
MIKITADINVLVSATYWAGEAYDTLELVESGKIDNIVLHEIMNDYKETWDDDELIEKVSKFSLIASKSAEKITAMSILVHPREKLNVVKDDPDDDKIIEAAVEGKVDYIVSYDNHLLKLKEYRGIKIVTPKQFLNLFRK